MDPIEMQMPEKLTLIHGLTLWLVYSFGGLFLGIAMAYGTVSYVYQVDFSIARPLICAAVSVIAAVACWIAFPANRPHIGGLVLRVSMVWALMITSIILHRWIDVHKRLTPQEVSILGTAAVMFSTGVFISRRTSLGKKWFR
jgi:hypothetical protein